MGEFFEKALTERRSLEQVFSDLKASYNRRPDAGLVEKIRNLEAEITCTETRHATRGRRKKADTE